MPKIITLNELNQGWAVYEDILTLHKTDLEILQKAFNELYNKAYSTGGWSLSKSIFIDTRVLFWYWSEAAVKSNFLDSLPDSNILFWKEYWTFTLIVLTLMFADNMAERARKKTKDPDWGFQFKIYDGSSDLLYITVKLVNTRTGAHAPYDGDDFYPSVRVYFPTYSLLRALSEQKLEAGEFPISFDPDVNITESGVASSIADFGKELKKAVIAASNGNL